MATKRRSKMDWLYSNLLVGNRIAIEKVSYRISGRIDFQQGSYCWREFKLISENQGIYWLSIDKDNPDELYSLFQPSTVFFSLNDPEVDGEKYQLTESGTATVVGFEGDVEVEKNEQVLFREFHGIKNDQKLLSYEKWSDEIDFSTGKIISLEQIEYQGIEAAKNEQTTISYNELRNLRIGQQFKVGRVVYTIVGSAHYRQGSYSWIEYRALKSSDKKEYWLVVEPQKTNCSLSLFNAVPAKKVSVNTTGSQAEYKGKTYTVEESGSAVVIRSSGDVDFDPNEKVTFTDFVNEKQEYLSKEKWSDGVEYSYGCKVSGSEFKLLEVIKAPWWTNDTIKKRLLWGSIIAFFAVSFAFSEGWLHFPQAKIEPQLKESTTYEEVTAVTFKDANKTKAKIYKSPFSVDMTCEELIKMDPERIEYVTTDQENIDEGEKMIQTKKETVLIYVGEDGETYIQIFPNKDYKNSYNSYRASNHIRLRSFYVGSRKWGSSQNPASQPALYLDGSNERRIDVDHYNGSVASARQNSINARKQDGGGTGFGK